MKHTRLNRLMAVFVTLALALQGIMPAVAYAEQRKVEVENHTLSAGQTKLLTNIFIDDVDAPTPGTTLDNRASVTASEGASWEIPVLWVRDDLHIDKDIADKGHTYLPVLAFFVPQDYALADDAVTVTLSDSLTSLFGTQETISVYDASTGITYIMPASLKDLFAQAASTSATSTPNEGQGNEQEDEQRSEQRNTQKPTEQDNDVEGLGGYGTIVEVYCAQTARDVLSDEDLQWLIELIIDYLEPQAVELLLDSFPAFREAANNGEIGKQIGLYIYYVKGDKDGIPEHESENSALAYVYGDGKRVNGKLTYGYLLAVDVDDLIKRDASGKPIRDAKTGLYTLVREGPAMVTLRNTIVHEMFHAFMDDYNRTGMAGATNLQDVELDANNRFASEALYNRWMSLRYPTWFREGTASAVENVYAFRYGAFQVFRRQQDANGNYGAGDLDRTFTPQRIFDNYLNAQNKNGTYLYYELEWSRGGTQPNGEPINPALSRYVTGYLATLYLSELAARYNGNYAPAASSVQIVNGVTTVDSNKLRNGLNSMLKWMHDGSTLDQVISMISPKGADGKPIYTDTKSFEDQFIRGVKRANSTRYDADMESLNFVNTFLNYMLYLDEPLPNDEAPNGSILFDFNKRFDAPIDPNKKSSSEYFKIVESNTVVPSTVKNDTANIGGGKSNPDQATANSQTPQTAQAAKDDAPPMAAKTDDGNGSAAAGKDATEGAATDNAATEDPASTSGTTENGATTEEAPGTDATNSEPAAIGDDDTDATAAEDAAPADAPVPENPDPAGDDGADTGAAEDAAPADAPVPEDPEPETSAEGQAALL
ncbi:MAG: hypothetical protein Q4A01_06470 [Coriobacteriales bacterium]|nr:hypothetical protein [Coriobacteriales bacterium]